MRLGKKTIYGRTLTTDKPMPFSHHNIIQFKKRLLLALASLLASYLCFWLFPSVFQTLNAKVVDRLFIYRSGSDHFKPDYDDTIVHIDLNDSSLKALKTYYLNRSHYARVIRNLSAMGVSAQLVDFIFAAPSSEPDDRALKEATEDAGSVYYGMAFELNEADNIQPPRFRSDADKQYLDATAWQIKVIGESKFMVVGTNPLITFPTFSEAAKGTGFISIKSDPDGVFRRIPLLIRYENGFYPSFPFRALCDYLQVPPEKIILNPGKSIVLKDAVKPYDDEGHDIVIPIDQSGNMIINFIGPWGSMKHYSFAKVFETTEEKAAFDVWEEALSDKIALISDVSTGSTDVGPVPTDRNYPLSGIHSNIIHTILTESFLKEPALILMLGLELVLMGLIIFSSLYFTTLSFSLSAVGIAALYSGTAVSFFLFSNLIFNIVRPLMMIFFSMVSILVISAIENATLFAETEKAREIAERDLEIGRQIQAGFFPAELPAISGWELAAHFQSARQVAGDFYDVFAVDNNSKIAVIVSDICDKGVGAALFMALTRSLIRAFSLQRFEEKTGFDKSEKTEDETEAALKSVVSLTNDYLAETHSEANMFATLFFGILEPETGNLTYINAGHEMPMVFSSKEVKEYLNPTGPAVGAFPGLDHKTRTIRLEPGDFLFAYTDGVVDANNKSGEFFTKDRLISILTQPSDSASAELLLERIKTSLYGHMEGAEQFDDVTMVLVHRNINNTEK